MCGDKIHLLTPDMKTETIFIAGNPLCYDTAGQGSPVLLLPSSGHWLTKGNPNFFRKALATFLSS
jgi:hypothetical protein